MSRLDSIFDGATPDNATLSERAMLLADRVGGNLRQVVPPHAGKWLNAGMKLGALKAGTRVAGKFARRNPAVLVAAAAGAGAIWYLARRRARQVAEANGETEAAQGRSRKVAAKRGNGRKATSGRARKTAD